MSVTLLVFDLWHGQVVKSGLASDTLLMIYRISFQIIWFHRPGYIMTLYWLHKSLCSFWNCRILGGNAYNTQHNIIRGPLRGVIRGRNWDDNWDGEGSDCPVAEASDWVYVHELEGEEKTHACTHCASLITVISWHSQGLREIERDRNEHFGNNSIEVQLFPCPWTSAGRCGVPSGKCAV